MPDSPKAGKCAAAMLGREGRHQGQEWDWHPRTLAAEGVLEVDAKAHSIFPQQALVKGRKVAKHTVVPLAGRGVCLLGSWRGQARLPGRLLLLGDDIYRSVGMRTLSHGARLWLGCLPGVEVPAHSWGLCSGLGAPPVIWVCPHGLAPRHPRWAHSEFLWSHQTPRVGHSSGCVDLP